MPPVNGYQPVPYVGESYRPNLRILDLMRSQGHDAADAELRRGEIAAQMWGNVGNTIANAAAGYQKSKTDAQEQEARNIQIQNAKDEQSSRRKATEDASILQSAQSSRLAPDEVKAQLQQLGRGDLVPIFEKTWTDLEASRLRLKDLKNTSAQAEADYFGSLAVGIKKAKYDPMAIDWALKEAESDGHDVAAFRAQLQQNPTALPTIVEQLIAKSPTQTKLAAEDADREQKRKDQEADNTRQAAQAAEVARHNLEQERIAKLTSDRASSQAAETARHNLAMEKAANPFAAAMGPQGNNPATGPQGAPLTGEDFLKTLNPQIASEVKAYAEGKRPFPSGMSYAKLQPMIALVGQYDPTFDASNYNARNKARSDLTSPNGTGGKTINALNTAIQHAGRLSDLIETLGNSEYPVVNTVLNPIRTGVGSTKVTNYKAVAPQLAKEIERAWRGAGGSTSDIKQLIDSIGSNMGKQQQREALLQFVELAKGKLDSTQQQRDNVMGAAGASIPVLFDQNKAILDSIVKRAGGENAGAPGRIYYDANGNPK